MAVSFETMRSYEDKRVRMRFDDDHECVATLLSASQDMDGSLHLIYDKIEWTNDTNDLQLREDSATYAEGESLVSIEEADTLRGSRAASPGVEAITRGFEFHDSILLELERKEDGTGFALFQGYIYESDGIVFEDAQKSGWQNIRFLFTDMTLEGSFPLNERAAEGDLWVEGVNGNGTTLIPAKHHGDIRMELQLSPEFGISNIYAKSISSQLEGEFELEAIWDADLNRTKPPD